MAPKAAVAAALLWLCFAGEALASHDWHVQESQGAFWMAAPGRHTSRMSNKEQVNWWPCKTKADCNYEGCSDQIDGYEPKYSYSDKRVPSTTKFGYHDPHIGTSQYPTGHKASEDGYPTGYYPKVDGQYGNKPHVDGRRTEATEPSETVPGAVPRKEHSRDAHIDGFGNWVHTNPDPAGDSTYGFPVKADGYEQGAYLGFDAGYPHFEGYPVGEYDCVDMMWCFAWTYTTHRGQTPNYKLCPRPPICGIDTYSPSGHNILPGGCTPCETGKYADAGSRACTTAVGHTTSQIGLVCPRGLEDAKSHKEAVETMSGFGRHGLPAPVIQWPHTQLPTLPCHGCKGCGYRFDPTGWFSELSGTYARNSDCKWVIAPNYGFHRLFMRFLDFDIEQDRDFLTIYQCADHDFLCNPETNVLVDRLTGTLEWSQKSFKSDTGIFLVHFTSDYSTQKSGFTATYEEDPVPILGLITPEVSSQSPHPELWETPLATPAGLPSLSCTGCHGCGVLMDAAGGFTELSGTYAANSDCQWIVAPNYGVNTLGATLTFTDFVTEAVFDTVKIYKCASLDAACTTGSATLMQDLSGTEGRGQTYTADTGIFLVHFTSDAIFQDIGFVAVYAEEPTPNVNLSVAIATGDPDWHPTKLPTLSCRGCTGCGYFFDKAGTIIERPGTYARDSDCKWVLAPSYGAHRSGLSFVDFDTDDGVDFVTVYQCAANDFECKSENNTQVISLSGTAGRGLTYTSHTGIFLVHFTSITRASAPAFNGFAINYFEDPDPIPSDLEPLLCQGCDGCAYLFEPSGSFSETIKAHGTYGYYSTYSDCRWVISPSRGANGAKLTFNEFDTEAGQDFVSIYQCADKDFLCNPATNTLIGKRSGKLEWDQWTYKSVSGIFLIDFKSDIYTEHTGFTISYEEDPDPPCVPTNPGLLDLPCVGGTGCGYRFDSSGIIHVKGTVVKSQEHYAPNSDCQWIIAPEYGVPSATLRFMDFLLRGSDFVRVYECADQDFQCNSGTNTLLAELTGEAGHLQTFQSTTGIFLVQFTSADGEFYTHYSNQFGHWIFYFGWSAQYSVDPYPTAAELDGTNPLTCTNGDTCAYLFGAEGSFKELAGSNTYAAGSDCTWIVAPSYGVKGGVLGFTEFETHDGTDFVRVFKCAKRDYTCTSGTEPPTEIAALSGVEGLHRSFTSDSGIFKITFVTTNSGLIGFTATYSENPVVTPCFTQPKKSLALSRLPPFEVATLPCVGCEGCGYRYESFGGFNELMGTYNPNSDCKWVVAPNYGAGGGTITFLDFDIESNYDFLTIYQCAAHDLHCFSGNNTVIDVITGTEGSGKSYKSDTGIFMIHFTSDVTGESTGFTLKFSGEFEEDSGTFVASDAGSIVEGHDFKHTYAEDPPPTPTPMFPQWSLGPATNPVSSLSPHSDLLTPPCLGCEGCGYYFDASGEFSESFGRYSPQSDCKWIVAPSHGVPRSTIRFTHFDTEKQHDFVAVYQCSDEHCEPEGNTLIIELSGTEGLGHVYKSDTGIFLIHFTSDSSQEYNGFTVQFTDAPTPVQVPGHPYWYPVHTLAGTGSLGFDDGDGSSATFNRPSGIAYTPDGLTALVSDTDSHTIRSIDIVTTKVTLIAGMFNAPAWADGIGLSHAQFRSPEGLTVTPDGFTAFVADTGNHVIRTVNLISSRTEIPYVLTTDVTTLCGTGQAGSANGRGGAASFSSPSDVAIMPDGTRLVVTERGGHRVRLITLDTHVVGPGVEARVVPVGDVTTLAGSGVGGFADGLGAAAQFNAPDGVSCNHDGLRCHVADTGNFRVRTITLSNSQVATLAGSGTDLSEDGDGTFASFNQVTGIDVTQEGDIALVSEGHRIRIVDLESGTVTTIAGSTAGMVEHTGTMAKFSEPRHIAVSPDTYTALVSDTANNRIRLIDTHGAFGACKCQDCGTLFTASSSSSSSTGGGGSLSAGAPNLPVVTDGVGNYYPYSDCRWIIAPGASWSADIAMVTMLTFREFTTELNRDIVSVYECGDFNCKTTELRFLAALSGIEGRNKTYTSLTGYFLVTFTSDGQNEYDGFVASYATREHQEKVACTGCSSCGTYVAHSGTFSDGGYGANAECSWVLAPGRGIDDVTENRLVARVKFTAFETERYYDYVTVYECENIQCHANKLVKIRQLSGTDGLGKSYESATGYFLVTLKSDSVIQLGGFTATFTNERFREPHDIDFSQFGDRAFVAEGFGNRVMFLDLKLNHAVTLAGNGHQGYANGVGTMASFNNPTSVAVTPDGLHVLVSDSGNRAVRKIEVSTGHTVTFVGCTDGINAKVAPDISCWSCRALSSSSSSFSMSSSSSHSSSSSSSQSSSSSSSSSVACTGQDGGIGTFARLSDPRGIAITPDGHTALVCDHADSRIRRIDLTTAEVTSIGGSVSNPVHITITPNGLTAYFTDGSNVFTLTLQDGTVAQLTTGITNPYGIAILPDSITAIVTDKARNQIYQFPFDGTGLALAGSVDLLAGSSSAQAGYKDWSGEGSEFSGPEGVAVSPYGLMLLVADNGNHRIRSIDTCPVKCHAECSVSWRETQPAQCDPKYMDKFPTCRKGWGTYEAYTGQW